MKRRTKIMLTCLLIVILGAFAWLIPRQSQPITVIGTLPAKDLANIESTVRHEIWRGTFPDSSMKTFKELPGNLNLRLSMRVVKVRVGNENAVAVTVRSSKKPLNVWCYVLKKTEAGWTIIYKGSG